MTTMSNDQKYSYRVSWSEEDEALVGTVAELPSLSVVEDDVADAFLGIRRLTAEVVQEMASAG